MRVDEIGLDFEITRDPVQAVGSIRGRAFVFIAKHSNWSFEVADDFGGFPSDTGSNPVFTIKGRFPSAADMTDGEVADIIEHCSRLLVRVGRT